MDGGFHMTDIAVVIVVLISGVLAFLRGFVREALGIAAWIGAAFIAMQVQPLTMGLAMDLIGMEVIAKYGSWVVIFLIALIILSIVSGAIANMIKDTSLNALDRSLGFVFGLARGGLLIAVVYFLGAQLMNKNAPPPEWLAQAKTYPLIVRGADIVSVFVPRDASEQAAREIEEKRRQGEALLEIQKNLQTLTAPPAGPATPQPAPVAPVQAGPAPAVPPALVAPQPAKPGTPAVAPTQPPAAAPQPKPAPAAAPNAASPGAPAKAGGGYDDQQRNSLDAFIKNKQ
jgi:membrane protein required for colicin V production